MMPDKGDAVNLDVVDLGSELHTPVLLASDDQVFENDTDKLVYMAKILPDVFSEGTPFSIHALDKPWKNKKEP
ncbi:MAG: hypothetical protein K2O49_09730 [Muribaculaceae bacterium]|nr:hypothetical protein [Muribaculaceae bacterium]